MSVQRIIIQFYLSKTVKMYLNKYAKYQFYILATLKLYNKTAHYAPVPT